MNAAPVQFMGVPGSPYTRKMLAYLRFRHIPYRLLIGQQAEKLGLPRPKVGLMPTFYLPDEAGEMRAVVDSTPLIRRFEAEYAGRSALPTDPALRFIDYLLEDFGDEWMTKAMFHYRWYYEADIEMAGSVLPSGRRSASRRNSTARARSSSASGRSPACTWWAPTTRQRQ